MNPGDIICLDMERPHQIDDCPICVARRDGRACTVGEYRAWLRQFGQAAVPLLMKLRGTHDDELIDPPSERRAVYVTSDEPYAMFYAGQSRGDLYEVKAVGEMQPSPTDHFPTWTVNEAVVVKVLRRGVIRTRRERRDLERRWKKADEMSAQTGRKLAKPRPVTRKDNVTVMRRKQA